MPEPVAEVRAELKPLRLPAGRSLPRADDPGDGVRAEATALVCRVRAGEVEGVGYALVSGRAELALLEDGFAPLAAGLDPAHTERLYGKARQQRPEILLGGAEARAYAALDVAIWDLHARQTGRPLGDLLGGVRGGCPAHTAATALAGLPSDRVIELARAAIDAGARGVLVGVTGRDPVRDAGRLQRIRDAVGEEVWFGVSGHQGLDLNTALAFGRFLEEELDADLYAEPCPAQDVEAYARLAGELELPVAAGSTLGAAAFTDLVSRTRVGVLRPDLARVGGLTPLLKIAALAELSQRAVIPAGYPEVAVHVAAGRPAAVAIELTPWGGLLFEGGPACRDGVWSAPAGPGLGVRLKA
jgi:L-alanine-DL-glutamate epimerase-like enolase superfamily enzyme